MATVEIKIPDIGDFDEVSVAEVLISAGDDVAVDDPLISLESDKATMEVPAEQAGRIAEVKVSVGDNVAAGTVIATLEPAQSAGDGDSDAEADADERDADEPSDSDANDGTADDPKPTESAEDAASEKESGDATDSAPARQQDQSSADDKTQSASGREPPVPHDPSLRSGDETVPHASPSVRRFARELGADIAKISGSGRKGRILEDDVRKFVKTSLAGAKSPAGASGGMEVAPQPQVDFAKFGEVEEVELSRIRKLSGAYLHRNWVTIPHVTQHDEADVTEMEAFRQANADEAKDKGVKLTPLVFLIKACVSALQAFPDFNASLAPDGQRLIRKKYFHIGIAVDTPDGLVVPVIRDCDTKSLFQLAEELGEMSGRAREKKLKPDEMQGGCFSISSLGGIGGTAFTPIVNLPEVAILGVSRSAWTPVWRDDEFVPRLMLPLSLSYDHRVIDGAAAARFTQHLAKTLGDIRRLLL